MQVKRGLEKHDKMILQQLGEKLQDSGGGLLDDAGPIAGEVETLSGGLPLH